MALILIVEDDEQVRVLAESVLQDAGHTVIAATGADGALALLEHDPISAGGRFRGRTESCSKGQSRPPEAFRSLHHGRGRQRGYEGYVHGALSFPPKALHAGATHAVRCLSCI